MSESANRFLASLRGGGREWADFLDYDSFRASSPSEQTELVRVLEQALVSAESDPRVPQALAALLPADEALAILARADAANIDALGSAFDVFARRTLDRAYVVAKDATRDARTRQRAIELMQQIAWPEVTVFLGRLTEDPVMGQRAADALFSRLRLADQSSLVGSWANVLRVALSSDEPSIAKRARAELARVALAGGLILANVELLPALSPEQAIVIRGGLPSGSDLSGSDNLAVQLALESNLMRLEKQQPRALQLLRGIASAETRVALGLPATS